MSDRQKPEPQPLDESQVIGAALSKATKGDIGEDLAISLKVSGGTHSQRYRFSFATRGGRLEACQVDCELSDRHGAHDGGEVDAKTMASLGRSLLGSGLLTAEAVPPRFLPDTVVGIIEITSGDTTHRTYFAADPDQAAVQDMTPSDAVLKAADAIYKTAGNILDIKNVRP